jgi:hypothetical protein
MRFLAKHRTEPQWPPMDRQETAWVSTNRRPFETFSVGSLVPEVFDRYARVLHPASSYDNLPVRWAEVAGWSGRTSHALAQWELLARPLDGRELGRRPFILPPRVGGLPTDQLQTLCALLIARAADPERCLIATWEGYVSPGVWLTAPPSGNETGERGLEIPVPPLWASARELRLEYRAFLVIEGAIRTIAGLTDRHASYGFQLPPTLFWPADRAWFVASDPDLDSTYVGGSAALVDAILADPTLESWPAAPDDDISIGADEINLDPEEVVPAGQLSWFDPPEPEA